MVATAFSDRLHELELALALALALDIHAALKEKSSWDMGSKYFLSSATTRLQYLLLLEKALELGQDHIKGSQASFH